MADVRVLEEADVPVLVATFPEPRRPINRHVERFARHQAGDVTCLVAWDGERPIGYVFARWPGGQGGLTEQALALGCVEFGDLFVAEDARGQGAGRALMEALEALALSRGFNYVGFEVTATNPLQNVARGLYERLGYTDAGFGEFMSGYTY